MLAPPARLIVGEVAYVEPPYVRTEPPLDPLNPQAGLVTLAAKLFENVHPWLLALKSQRLPLEDAVSRSSETDVPLTIASGCVQSVASSQTKPDCVGRIFGLKFNSAPVKGSSAGKSNFKLEFIIDESVKSVLSPAPT